MARKKKVKNPRSKVEDYRHENAKRKHSSGWIGCPWEETRGSRTGLEKSACHIKVRKNPRVL